MSNMVIALAIVVESGTLRIEMMTSTYDLVPVIIRETNFLVSWCVVTRV